MAHERYSTVSEENTSGTADTNTFPLGLQSAASRGFGIYEFIAAIKAAASDTRQVAEVSAGVTTAFTGNTAQTPVPIYIGGAAATASGFRTFTTAPTPATSPMIRLTFNGRATVRWAAIDPDSRLYAQAGGGLNGQLFVINRNSAAAAVATLNELLHVE